MAKTTDEELRSYLTALGAVGYFNDKHDNFTFVLNDGDEITAEAYGKKIERRYELWKRDRGLRGVTLSTMAGGMRAGTLPSDISDPNGELGMMIGASVTCSLLVELYTMGEIDRKYSMSVTKEEKPNAGSIKIKENLMDAFLKCADGSKIYTSIAELAEETGINKNKWMRFFNDPIRWGILKKECERRGEDGRRTESGEYYRNLAKCVDDLVSARKKWGDPVSRKHKKRIPVEKNVRANQTKNDIADILYESNEDHPEKTNTFDSYGGPLRFGH